MPLSEYECSTSPKLSVGLCAQLACILEVSAPKPGNVHRGADFQHLTFLDFLLSAAVVGPVLEQAIQGKAFGELLLESVQATRNAVGTNTNLGLLLLMTPLAMVPYDKPLRSGVSQVLKSLGEKDARLAYEAIRLASPGGMGHSEQSDLSGPPPNNLLAAMDLAKERDLIARQYVTDFADLFDRVVPWLREAVQRPEFCLADGIVWTYLKLLHEFPDSLVARKCGIQTAQGLSVRAGAVLASGPVGGEAFVRAAADLDFWLRSDGNQRNPGTSADMIGAGLFVLLREGVLVPPFSFYPSL